MKTMVKIFLGLVILSFGSAVFAADIDLSVSPLSQTAISGSVMNWTVTVTNNTGIDVYLTPDLGIAQEAKYLNSSITPINLPAITLMPNTDPYWKLLSGQSMTLTMSAKMLPSTYSFSLTGVDFRVSTDTAGIQTLTSSFAPVSPIADLAVSLASDGIVQLPGDLLWYTVLVKNVWSATATGLSLISVFPTTILNFPNIWFLNGITQVPTIYNSLINNYQFTLWNLQAGQSATLVVTGSLKSWIVYNTVFTHQAFVLSSTPQYTWVNDTVTLASTVVGTPDLVVSAQFLSGDWANVGDPVTLVVNYTNNGTVSATGAMLTVQLLNGLNFSSSYPMPAAQNGNTLSRNIADLAPGASGIPIMITGTLQAWMQVGDAFSAQASLTSQWVEANYINNTTVVSGTMKLLTDVTVALYANNLTRPTFDTNSGTAIKAVSGDLIQLTLAYNNRGNSGQITNISLTNLTSLLGANFVAQNITVPAHTAGSFVITGVVANKNFWSFAPVVHLTYGTITRTDDVTIQEPLQCGDGFVTQNEVCDTFGQVGVLYSGQVCENVNNACVLNTQYIINTACFEYTSNLGTGQTCTTNTIAFVPAKAQCTALTAPHTTVIVDANNQWSMDFSCAASGTAQTIVIDCGNGTRFTWTNVASYTHACTYTYNSTGSNVYNVACYVDGTTNASCQQSTLVDPGFYGVCGNWRIELGEQCDFINQSDTNVTIGSYLNDRGNLVASNSHQDWQICRWCRIRDDQFAYESAKCLGVNTSISVQMWEILPFRWKLETSKNMKVKSDYTCTTDTNQDKTYIDQDSLKCTFKVYNGDNYTQENQDAAYTFTKPCDSENNGNIFDYFDTQYNADNAFGKYTVDVNDFLKWSTKQYGEYKLVLEKVSFDYCNPQNGQREQGNLYDRVCEVNFTVTKPYLIQKSAFGATPKATTDIASLNDYYDIQGNRLVDSTDLKDVMTLDANTYAGGTDMLQTMDDFSAKYEKLALTIDKSKLNLGSNVTEVKKVPNKQIYIIKGNGDLTFKQQGNFSSPFTMIIKGMDVIVDGSIKTNGMIITDKTMTFNELSSDDKRCQEGGQIVQGIFVARGGFVAADDTKTRNTDANTERCADGNLTVKWVLIWKDVFKLVASRRANLNHWFQVTASTAAGIKAERRNEILKGAAVLIEYSPSLWTALPPGAEDFTQALEVYKK